MVAFSARWHALRRLALALSLLSSLAVLGCSRGAGSVRIAALPSGTATESAIPSSSPSATPVPTAEPQPIPLALMLSFTFPLDDLTWAQTQALLDGRMQRWSDAGGPDLPVQRLGWDGHAVVAAQRLEPGMIPREVVAEAALEAAVARQPGALALLPWDGPRLQTKVLSIDGHRPDEAEYPLFAPSPAGADLQPADGAVIGKGRFSLAAAGDLMLGRRVSLRVSGQPPDYPLARVAGDLLGVDAAIANLEVALTGRGDPLRKDYTFRARPELAAGLRGAGITALALANNHVFDFGATGLAETVTTLDAAGIAHAGAGADDVAAARPAILNLEGTRVALLSFVNVPNDTVSGFVTSSLAAAPGRAGVNWGTPETVARAVAAARTQADVVIVTMHAGTEYADQPDDVQRSLAHAAIEAGAALVIGAHPHVLQGIEYYRDGVILYSLGNFVFDLDNDDQRVFGLAAAQTVIVRLEFRDGHVHGLELRPVVIDPSEFRPVPARGNAARSILDRIYRLTELLKPAP